MPTAPRRTKSTGLASVPSPDRGPAAPFGPRARWIAALLLAATFALRGLWRLRRDPPALALSLGVVAGYLMVYGSVSSLWSRYLFPLVTLLTVPAAGGVDPLARALAGRATGGASRRPGAQ